MYNKLALPFAADQITVVGKGKMALRLVATVSSYRADEDIKAGSFN